MKKQLLIVTVVALILLFALRDFSQKSYFSESAEELRVEVYKTPYCSCCEKYVQYLKEEGFNVTVVEVESLKDVRSKLKIPRKLLSCHTSLIGKYFVEGHVPAEVVKKLVIEKPKVRGIALPGMPPGAPGMPGEKKENFVIYYVSDDGIGVFAVV